MAAPASSTDAPAPAPAHYSPYVAATAGDDVIVHALIATPPLYIRRALCGAQPPAGGWRQRRDVFLTCDGCCHEIATV